MTKEKMRIVGILFFSSFIFLIGFNAQVSIAQTQTYTTTLIKTITGGEVRDVAVDQQFSTVYIASEGTWKSTDLGESWKKIGPGGRGIEIAPSNPKVIYSADLGNLFKSTDGGNTWSTWSTILNKRVEEAIAVDPANADVVYAGTGGGQVYITRNGGASWEVSTIPIAGTVEKIVVDPTNNSIIYASFENNGVWKSEDSGKTWVQLYNEYARALAIAPSNPKFIYTSTAISHDGGKTWFGGVNQPRAWVIAVHPQNENVAYYGKPGDAVFATTNGGKLFFQVQGIGVNYDATEVEGLAIDAKNDIVYAGGDTIFKGQNALSGKVRFKPSDKGFHTIGWTDMKATQWAVWISSDSRGVHKIENEGRTVQYSVLGLNGRDSIRRLAPSSNPLIAYAGHESHLFKTLDGGKSWHVIFNAEFPSPFVDPTNPDIVYFYSQGVIRKSVDGGNTWQTLPMTGSLVGLHPINKALFATNSTGLYRSDDGGQNWIFLSSKQPFQLFFSPTNSDVMFFVGDVIGIVQSIDGGKTWTRLTSYPGKRPRRFAETKDGSIWVTDVASGLYRSTNQGATWTQIYQYSTFVIAPDPWDPDSLFVSGSGGIFWVHPNSTSREQPAFEGPKPEPQLVTIQLNACQMLDRSNTIYELNQDIEATGGGSCFLMPRGLHDITIDGKGHTISYGTNAVFVDDIENFTIKNVKILQTKSGLGGAALVLTNSRNMKIINMTMTLLSESRERGGINAEGIFSDNIEIADSTLSVGSFGQTIVTNGQATIQNNKITGSSNTESMNLFLSDNSVIERNNISIGGDGTGFKVFFSKEVRIANNNIRGVGKQNNLYLSHVQNSQLINNQIVIPPTLESGLSALVIQNSQGNLVQNNYVYGGSRNSFALVIRSSSGNQFKGNIVRGGDYPGHVAPGGILIGNSNNNTFEGNTISVAGQNPSGIKIRGSASNTITSSTINVPGGPAIILEGSSDNTIYNNKLTGNVTLLTTDKNNWNITKQPGTNIMGNPFLGGNFYKGISGACTDENKDGFCDSSVIHGINNIDYLPLIASLVQFNVSVVCGDGVCSLGEKLVCSDDCVFVKGNLSDVVTNLLGVRLRVNGSEDVYQSFSERLSVEFLEVNESAELPRVRFDFGFDLGKWLMLSRLKILKQQLGDKKGYLLVSGLNLTTEKKSILIDKINVNSSAVCVKDAEVNDVSEVSAACNGLKEFLVGCDGKDYSGYVCKAQDGFFNVSGLSNSVVVEYIESCGNGRCGYGESCGTCSFDCGVCYKTFVKTKGEVSKGAEFAFRKVFEVVLVLFVFLLLIEVMHIIRRKSKESCK